ncbi:MAG: MFS transporter [Deltaproteobacteria bacterium]|nr:MFS transporter [Deltaproteobacteria bacterium]
MLNKSSALRSLVADFLIKFTNQFIFTALMVCVYQKSNRAIDIGIISVAMLLPSLVFVYFSNIIIHHFSSFSILRFGLITRGFILLVGALAAKDTYHFAIVAAIAGLLQQIIGTSKLSYDSHLIPSGKRVKFNSKRAFLGSLAIIIGPTLGGAMTGILGGLFALGLMGIISLIIFFIPQKNHFESEAIEKIESKVGHGYGGILNTLKYLRSTPDILIIVVLYIIVTAILEISHFTADCF